MSKAHQDNVMVDNSPYQSIEEQNENKLQENGDYEEVVGHIKELGDNNGKKLRNINKRIDFDKKTYLRLEMMIPLYKQELDGNPSENETIAHIVKIALDRLFEEEFKRKIADL